MSECNHNCSECNSKNCSERSLIIEAEKNSSFKHIIGVVSVKGGVGKSLITTLLASKKNKQGYSVGILDADVNGPSIPKAFKLVGPLYGENNIIKPLESRNGIKIVSASLLLDNNNEPILWRGPMLSNMVKQFYSQTNFGDLDYLFIDMPPGTSDVNLTIFQSIKLSGIVIVTTPTGLVNEIVAKTVEMANKMNIKVLGIVNNMAYINCPKCNEKIYPFNESNINELVNKYNLKILGELPIDSQLAKLVDSGEVENYDINKIDLDF